jgi:hypothetical protein
MTGLDTLLPKTRTWAAVLVSPAWLRLPDDRDSWGRPRGFVANTLVDLQFGFQKLPR